MVAVVRVIAVAAAVICADGDETVLHGGIVSEEVLAGELTSAVSASKSADSDSLFEPEFLEQGFSEK